ncbi:clusterin [Diretmus argenteus]
MLMMIMMMKKKVPRSLAVVALLLASANCIVPVSKEDLKQISLLGEQYLDKQIENAVNGVKEMKNVMEMSSEDHKRFLSALEKTKQQKEEALRTAQQMEAKLEQEEEVCNETMQALWEECKPCLKNTCIKYYSRTCSSGSGLVGRQLEELLNRTSPFSIWINGENMDVLEREGQRQKQHFHNLEERYSEVADSVDGMFMDSMKVFDHMRTLQPPLFSSPFRMPSLWRESAGIHRGLQDRPIRVARSPFHEPDFHGFRSMFQPMMGMARSLFGSMGSMVDPDVDTHTSGDGSVNEDVVIIKPLGDGRMTCKEIRRNSAGCIKLRDECQKCKEIQNIDCSGNKPLQGPLKAELEEALALVERFTQEYNALLQRFEQEMLNTSAILDLFNSQFGWVSALANSTKTEDGIFHVQTVISKDNEEEDTNVSVQLFDTPPMTFTVPGDIPWSDPKFPEVVAQEALDRYKESAV